eukprot:scaffold275688_cov44-Attheya_sp.AAC.1
MGLGPTEQRNQGYYVWKEGLNGFSNLGPRNNGTKGVDGNRGARAFQYNQNGKRSLNVSLSISWKRTEEFFSFGLIRSTMGLWPVEQRNQEYQWKEKLKQGFSNLV